VPKIRERVGLKIKSMDFKLYVIKGQENAGKTNACWKLLSKFKESIEYVNYWELRSSDAIYIPDKLVYENSKGNTCDFIVIFKHKIRQERIAIISTGDEAWVLKKDIFHVLSQDVTTIICCSRTINRSNSTYRMLNRYFKKHIVWSEEITFSKDITIKQKYEEEIVEKIYSQLLNN
jgi:hypothetical protein